MQDDPLLEQLDWSFSSCHWTQTFPNTIVTTLGKPVSDHSPCVVNIETSIPRSKIFRFEFFWINHAGFLEIVQSSWNKPCHASNSAALLCKKLKTLRYDLKQWSKGISRLSILIQNCNWALGELDGLEDQCALSTPEANFRLIVKAHLLKLLHFQNEYWQKRCTIRYIKFGEENTKLFQALATERYRRNSIASLKLPDGTLVTDHNAKEAVLFNVYKERLGACSVPTMKFNLPAIIKKIDGLEALTIPFTRKEIDEVVRSMPTNRAPGPDGFNGAFLKSCWHLIKRSSTSCVMTSMMVHLT